MFDVQATTINRIEYTDSRGKRRSAEPGVVITIDAAQANELELAGALIVTKEEPQPAPQAEVKDEDKSSKKSR